MAELTIDDLGHRGDGIARTAEGPVHVAGALPGERVAVERTMPERARLVSVLDASPERAVPPCPHFGVCGGCVAQHMAAPLYRRWKVAGLERALQQAGIPAPVGDLTTVPPHSRRRVVLALGRAGRDAVLGFHEARSTAIVPIETCVVAEPAVVRALPALRRMLGPLAPPKGERDVWVTATRSGLDVAVGGPPVPRPAQDGLLAAAAEAGFARITVAGEVLATFRPPILDIGGVAVTAPPGGFVQAVAAAEEALAAEVGAAVGGAKRVADLFSGAGAFALRLARLAAVHAVEGEGAPLEALGQAARRASGLKPVTTERRDLFRRPLRPEELKRFDAVVLDPPRQGAEAQVRALAASAVRRVAYVSCAPATFARDARLLVDAGFRLERVRPVDQFLWSHHLETSAAFRR